MVLPVSDKDVAAGVDGNALQTLELGVALAPTAEGAEEGPVRVEDLDPVVARVGHKDETLFVDSYSSGYIISYHIINQSDISNHIISYINQKYHTISYQSDIYIRNI